MRRAIAVRGASVAVVSAVAAVLLTIALRPPSRPEVITRAVSHFREGRLPAATAAAQDGPDLSGLGLIRERTATTVLAGIRVEAFTYRRGDGRGVHLYLARSRLPFPRDALGSPPGGPWLASVGDIDVLGAALPRPILVVSEDLELLLRVAASLGVPDLGSIFAGPTGGSGYFVP
jgi:hypothetical protein